MLSVEEPAFLQSSGCFHQEQVARCLAPAGGKRVDIPTARPTSASEPAVTLTRQSKQRSQMVAGVKQERAGRPERCTKVNHM